MAEGAVAELPPPPPGFVPEETASAPKPPAGFVPERAAAAPAPPPGFVPEAPKTLADLRFPAPSAYQKQQMDETQGRALSPDNPQTVGESLGVSNVPGRAVSKLHEAGADVVADTAALPATMAQRVVGQVQPPAHVPTYEELPFIQRMMAKFLSDPEERQQVNQEITQHNAAAPPPSVDHAAELRQDIKGAIGPGELPPPSTAAEKYLVDLPIGVAKTAAEIGIQRKFLPESAQKNEIAAWELQNQAAGGTPGVGALMGGTVGAMGKAFPKAPIKQAVGEAVAFGAGTYVATGNIDESVVNALLPVAMRTPDAIGWVHGRLSGAKTPEARQAAIDEVRQAVQPNTPAEQSNTLPNSAEQSVEHPKPPPGFIPEPPGERDAANLRMQSQIRQAGETADQDVVNRFQQRADRTPTLSPEESKRLEDDRLDREAETQIAQQALEKFQTPKPPPGFVPELPAPRERVPQKYSPEDLANALPKPPEGFTPEPHAATSPPVSNTEAPAAASPKQPWEMTEGEYRRTRMDEEIALRKAEMQPGASSSTFRVITMPERKAWSVEHRVAVEQALRAGKPVPPEVLKDYPDLQASPAPAPSNRPTDTGNKPVPQAPERTRPAGTPPGVSGTDVAAITSTQRAAPAVSEPNPGESQPAYVRRRVAEARQVAKNIDPGERQKYVEGVRKEAAEAFAARATKEAPAQDAQGAAAGVSPVAPEPSPAARPGGSAAVSEKPAAKRGRARAAKPAPEPLETKPLEKWTATDFTHEDAIPTLEKRPWWEIDKFIKSIADTEGYRSERSMYGGRRQQEPTIRYKVATDVLSKKLEAQQPPADRIGEVLPAGYEEGRGLKGVGAGMQSVTGYRGKAAKLEAKRLKTGEVSGAIRMERGERELQQAGKNPPEHVTEIQPAAGALSKSDPATLKRFIETVPEFKLDPNFTVVGEKGEPARTDRKGRTTGDEDSRQLQFQDGGRYKFNPEALGIALPDDAVAGDRVGIDVDAVKGMKKGQMLVATRDMSERAPLSNRRNVLRPSGAVPLPAMLDAARASVRGVRERYADVEHKYGSDLANKLARATTPGTEAESIIRFWQRNGADPATLQKLRDLGEHLRAENDIKLKGLPAAGLKTLTPAQETAIRADPKVQQAMTWWNKNVRPLINDIRTAHGLPMSKAGNLIDFFVNLPGEHGPANVQGGRTGTNLREAFTKAATGEGQYIADPREFFKQIIQNHLRTDATKQLVQSVKRDAVIPVADVKPPAGSTANPATFPKLPTGEYFEANFKGRTEKALPVDLAGPNEPADYAYVPKRVAEALTNIRQPYEPRDTIVDKALNAATTVGVTGSFLPHTARMLLHAGTRMAETGNSVASAIPWIGKASAAYARSREMRSQPFGQSVQLLIDRAGADKGFGYGVKPPTSTLGKIVKAAHEKLFNPETGIDPMNRRVVADSYLRVVMGNDRVNKIEQSVNAGRMSPVEASRQIEAALGPKDIQGMVRYVNGTLGWSNAQTRSNLLNSLARYFPFVSSESGKIPREIAHVATAGINPAAIVRHLQAGRYGQAAAATAGMIAGGAAGTYMLMNALNYANTKAQTGTGKFMWDNDRHHKFDVFVAPNWYLSNFDPMIARGARLLGIKEAANQQDAKAAPQAAALEGINEVFTVLNSGLRMLFTGATAVGMDAPRDLRFDERGHLMKSDASDFSPTSIGRNSIGALRRQATSGKGESVGAAAIRDAAQFGGFNLSHPTRSQAEQFLGEQAAKSEYASTPEQKARLKLEHGYLDRLRAKDPAARSELLRDKNLGASQKQEILRNARLSPLAHHIKKTDAETAVKAWELMTDAEKKENRTEIYRKIAGAELPPARKRELRTKLRAAA